ncbi:LysR family transcriptional regulator [Arundinibacter roseus]|uniref:LysR family transcriptional regulator n=1 Tax=Arundinibacter roseus TaxID=2070510 RepID=A0A4R4KIS3_9BACT|nr:LysR family transcriptional regulator [Arundinibacter roseus]TDB68134.1 LysR family transcriptional regulator [Arundinibacter roseus]
MLDFRLHVFYTVAKKLSFTKAAAELYISQPAVTRHIHELEQQFGMALFERAGRQISLTPAGLLTLHHAETIQANYRQLEYDLNALKGQRAGALHLGASSTIAQYVLPPVLAYFHEKNADVAISLISGNTEQIEQALLNKDIDAGIVEGRTHLPELHYEEFRRDEIVLIARADHPLAQRDELSLDELRSVPLVLRERGSGTLEVIEYALKEHGIKLSDLVVDMYLGSTESIKSYLFHSSCMAFISIYAIENELRAGTFRILDIQNLTISRFLYTIHRQGDPEPLADSFLRFARKYYNQT